MTFEHSMKPHLNKGLFSNYYLDELLPQEEEFNIPFSHVDKALEETKRIWDKTYLSSMSEPQLRKHFLDKVFEILGWTIDVEPPTPSGEWSKHPDYALFHTREDLKIAQKATKEEYFNKALCIGEAKRWGRPLDRKLKGEKDPFEVQNPSLQISRYLWLTGVKWGILTDGRYWRIFERESSKRLDIFYEIDLEDLVENGSIEDFKYFFLFFRRDAFPGFLEKVYKESVDYAEAVGEELKENVYQALKTLTQGFLSTPANKLKVTHLKEIHDNSLILLYRLLFILYAEYRGLLPIGENRFYTESYSLDALKKEIAGKLDKGEPIATSTYGYWNKLKELFEIINIGNSELGVPPYNGGLFVPEKHDFLEKYRIGNLYIAKAVDLLSRSSDRAYIDYGSLEIRHLGSIYEGLLEYKLKIADEDIVPVKEKGKEVFIPVEKAAKQKKKIKENEIVREGEVYLVTDKGERKSTGSYYTPDYIVKYIIENTLGPLVERIYREIEWAQEIKNNKRKLNEIFEEIIKENGEEDKENLLRLWGMTRSNQERRDFLLNMLDGAQPSHGYDPIERILQLKVLDPAMGSGHFLVEATDFLARELLKVLSGEPLVRSAKEMQIKEAQEPYGKTEPEEEEIRWARREVVERCIFGVDLNPLAVELGKLSLWLYTVSKDRPLNFLDHHLRCGNSLIGANISDLARFPELKKKKAKKGPVQIGLFESVFREKVSILLVSFELIETQPSDTVEQIREKERLYQDFRRIVSRFQDVADVWTSVYFGNEVDFGTYQRLQGELRSSEEKWKRLSQELWFKKAKGIAKEKNFFHWNLEFPEVFEAEQRKENPGFDAVVGNPPYVRIQELNAKSPDEVKYFNRFVCARGSYDLYILFVEKGSELTKKMGVFCYILPNKFMHLDFGQGLRGLISGKRTLYKVVDFGDNQIFPGQTTYTCLLFLREPSECFNFLKLPRLTSQKETERYLSGKSVSFLKELPDKIGKDPWLLLSRKQKAIVDKLDSNSESLGSVVEQIFQGLITSADHIYILKKLGVRNGLVRAYSHSIKEEVLLEPELLKPLVSGEDIDRYVYPETDKILIFPYILEKKGAMLIESRELEEHYPKIWKYLKFHETELRGRERGKMDHDHWHAFGRTQNLNKHERVKLGVARLSDRLRLISDFEGRVYFDNVDVNGILLKEKLSDSGNYILSVLNSKLLDWRFKLGSVPFRGNFYSANKQFISPLPIRRISFVTPKHEREKMAAKFENMYGEWIKGNQNIVRNIFVFVKERLEKKHFPDLELVKKHNADPINKNWQIKEDDLCDQSDVVHDNLAFLAEQLIEMNKEKQKEINGFFEWVESQLKVEQDKKGNTGIEALTGKTHIKNYLGDYQKGKEHLSFEEFWKILEKNKNRIQANLKSREIFDNIKTEYEKSLSRLLPIKEKLRKTDWLIDQVVYKLYGLTEGEIQLVEDVL